MADANSLPEDIEYAGFWVRFGATLLDTVIILLVTLPLSFAVYGPALWQEHHHKMVMGGWDIIINWILPAVAVVLFWFFRGATPGKMATAMKVVDEKTGTNPSVAQSVLRYFAYLVSILPFGLGFLWIAFDGKKQSWHDKIARTVVVRVK